MTARIPLPRELQTGAFSVDRALALGLGAKRLRGKDLEQPFWGVRTVRGPAPVPTAHDLACVYAARMPTQSFFSHVTAARLWGIPIPIRLQLSPSLDVGVPQAHFVPTGRGVRGHRLRIAPEDVVRLGGLRVTSLARTWCDLAALLDEEDLVAAGDFLLWRKRPRSLRLGRDDLAHALSRFHGRRGRPRLDATLPFLSDRSDSPPESAFRVRFAHAGFPPPAVNRDAFDDAGRFLGMPDLSFPEYRVAFDYEGDHHRTDPVQWAKDLKRAPRFENADWAYLLGGSADYADPGELLANVARRLRAHGFVLTR